MAKVHKDRRGGDPPSPGRERIAVRRSQSAARASPPRVVPQGGDLYSVGGQCELRCHVVVKRREWRRERGVHARRRGNRCPIADKRFGIQDDRRCRDVTGPSRRRPNGVGATRPKVGHVGDGGGHEARFHPRHTSGQDERVCHCRSRRGTATGSNNHQRATRPGESRGGGSLDRRGSVCIGKVVAAVSRWHVLPAVRHRGQRRSRRDGNPLEHGALQGMRSIEPIDWRLCRAQSSPEEKWIQVKPRGCVHTYQSWKYYPLWILLNLEGVPSFDNIVVNK
mmetsp:Transcript_8268/g.20328  ORF Transcript_8268/g.20328 Transcript_8268/m.20328 type:complete len:279 (-) Transcript_8268:353-1189(-)